jgi:hypothetical protein
MEQPCYKCGQVVEEGIPFCPHCGAPQIRVVVAEPAPALAGSGLVGPGGEAALDQAAAPPGQIIPGFDVPASWSQAVKPCALAALIAALAIVLRLMVPLIAALGAGFLAVVFYRRQNPQAAMRAASGARLGAIAGMFCSGLTAVLLALRVLILQEAGEVRNALVEAIQQTAARYSDPQFQASLDFLRSPTGLVFMLVMFLIFGFVVWLILGTLGGAVGGAILGRRDRS